MSLLASRVLKSAPSWNPFAWPRQALKHQFLRSNKIPGKLMFQRFSFLLDGYFPGLNFLSFKQQFPSPSQSTLFAHNSTVVGDVSVGDSSAIWFNAVVRGDTGSVRIGGNTMLLDNCVVIGGRGPINDLPASTHIGSYCTIGHSSVVENCVIEDYAIIGSNCVVSEGAYVEKKAALVADSVLLPGHRIPAGQIWGGSPAKFICDLDADTKEQFFSSVSTFSELAANGADMFTTPGGSVNSLEEFLIANP
jgi:carbonic anhydrase/acetyltransferase-like protein (isoleucine patch superfamily)